MTLGAILLYASSKRVGSLPRPRPDGTTQGFWLKLLGANLLFVALAFVNLESAGALGPSFEASWLGLAILFLGSVGLGMAGNRLLRRAAKHEALSAEAALSLDERRPVVYLRSFKDDKTIVLGSRLGRLSLAAISWTVMVSVEQEMTKGLARIGPVVAIGKPGERLPQLGASRIYVSDDEWQGTIIRLMKEASLVVVRGGPTANLWWEIEQAAALLPPERLILVSIGARADRKSFERAVEARFGPIRGASRRGLGRILYFDKSWKLHSEVMLLKLDWWSMLTPWRPYRVSIESAFQRVLSRASRNSPPASL